jgi:hypothetical protein
MRAGRAAGAAALALAASLLAGSASGEVYFSAEGGLGTTVERDRVLDRTANQAALFLSPSWNGEDADFAFDMVLRWEVQGWHFAARDWERPGDPLRVVRRAVYHPAGAGWSAGITLLQGHAELGPRLVLGDPEGAVEAGYAVPGLVARVESGGLRLEGFLDRLAEPNLAGVRGDWKAGERLRLSWEGAFDHAAPLVWTGETSGGRPRAAEEDPVSGAGAEAAIDLYRGENMEVFLAADAATLSSPSSRGAAAGGGGGLRFSFSPYYANLLEVSLRSLEADGAFLPAYFGETYQVERWGLPGLPPLASMLPGREGTRSRFNHLSLRYRLGGLFAVDGDLRREAAGPVESARLALRLVEEGTRGVEDGGRGLEVVAWSRVLAPSDRLFDTERTFARVTALYALFPHTLLRVSYLYSWMFREGATGAVGASEWVGGVIYSLTL